jgi:hypothetical protein
MAGPDPFDAKGRVIASLAIAARKSAGIPDYEADDLRLAKYLTDMAIKPTGRLSVPLRDPDCLPKLAEILQGFVFEILATHNEIRDPALRLLKLGYRTRETERRLRLLVEKKRNNVVDTR